MFSPAGSLPTHFSRRGATFFAASAAAFLISRASIASARSVILSSNFAYSVSSTILKNPIRSTAEAFISSSDCSDSALKIRNHSRFFSDRNSLQHFLTRRVDDREYSRRIKSSINFSSIPFEKRSSTLTMSKSAAEQGQVDPKQSIIDNSINKWEGPTGSLGSLERLCSISLRACQLMTPLINSIYQQILVPPSTSDGKSHAVVQKVKQDNSAFTIADGLVQRLLTQVLFENVSFRDIVGEEEEDDNTETSGNGKKDGWCQVQGLEVPENIQHLVESTRDQIEDLGKRHLNLESDKGHAYQKLTIFIDPIDGTREFSTGKGEQCSICIGFANDHGKAVAGVVYRPLSQPRPTWAAGAITEGYAAHNFNIDKSSHASQGGLLTTNGSISPFVESLINELQLPRTKSGGAGNKMLLLLENSVTNTFESSSMSHARSRLYIQDRGVSRWDTCAAGAVLEAFGGKLLKLTHFLEKSGESDERIIRDTMNALEMGGGSQYTYLASKKNLDFIAGTANITKYNARSSCASLDDGLPRNGKATNVEQVKPYSNLCGLVAFGKEWNTEDGMRRLRDLIQRAEKINRPSLD